MKSTIKSSKINIQYLFILLTYVFFVFLSYNTPLTGDDWTWGTRIGMARLENKFVDYNGRYLSNIFEIVMTRYDVIRFIIVAFFSSLLIYMVGRITSNRNTLPYLLLSFILILLTPTKVFAQTFGWTAGFINYVPSLALLLIYVFLVRNIYYDTQPTYNKSLIYLVIPLGLITQLIVEHVTLFAIFTAMWVIVYTYVKHKKIIMLHVIYLITLIVGSIIMFTNGAYLNVLKGADTYRTVSNDLTADMGLLERVYFVYSGNMYKFLFLENVLINVFIGILMIILIIRFVSNSKWINYVVKPTLLSIITGSILYLLVFKKVLGNVYLNTKTNDFEALLCALFFISIAITIAIFVKSSTYKIRLFYYLSGVVLLIAPFIFITPFGPRCVFASYIFMILVCLELLAYQTRSLTINKKSYLTLLSVIALVLIVVYSFIFTMNGTTSRARLVHLENEVAKNEKTIELQELPFPQFHWMPSPKPNMYHTKTFKMYYEVPVDTELEIIPFYKWREK